MSAPFVVAGCPARNRAWALPGWWSSLQDQTVKPEHALVLLNDCEDDSLGVVQSLAEASSQRPELHYEVFNTGVVGWHRGTPESGWKSGPHPRYHEDSCANLAFLRNRWVELCLERFPQATHLFSVDSDITPEPDALGLLLAADKPVVGAVVRNSMASFNFMLGWRGPVIALRGGSGEVLPDEPIRVGGESDAIDYFANKGYGPLSASLVGACALYNREVFDRGLRWGPHKNGEDVALAIQARELGVGLFVEPRARTRHFMNGPDQEPLR